MGSSGVGKTHLAVALGYRATQAGFRTRFIAAADLLMQLTTALRRNQLEETIKRITKPYKLLIIEEMGYLPMDREQANLLFQVVAKRYETGSLILTIAICRSASGTRPLLTMQRSRRRSSTDCCITHTSCRSPATRTG